MCLQFWYKKKHFRTYMLFRCALAPYTHVFLLPLYIFTTFHQKSFVIKTCCTHFNVSAVNLELKERQEDICCVPPANLVNSSYFSFLSHLRSLLLCTLLTQIFIFRSLLGNNYLDTIDLRRENNHWQYQPTTTWQVHKVQVQVLCKCFCVFWF